MGHSFVKYRDQAVMFHDYDVINVACLTLEYLDSKTTSLSEGVQNLTKRWRNLSDCFGPGCINLYINDYIRTDQDVQSLKRLLLKVRDWMLDRWVMVPGELLTRLFGAEGELEFTDRKSSDLAAAFNKLIQILDGKIA